MQPADVEVRDTATRIKYEEHEEQRNTARLCHQHPIEVLLPVRGRKVIRRLQSSFNRELLQLCSPTINSYQHEASMAAQLPKLL